MAAPSSLKALATRYDLPAEAPRQLDGLLGAVASSPHALTAVRDPARAVEVHVADALTGLTVEAIRTCSRLADLGSGGGFPGLVLAIALPGTQVTLVESVAKKALFLGDTAAALDLRNVAVVGARAEDWDAGRETQDIVTARALATLPVLLEYAAPLLRDGGSLVAWKGRRDPDEEERAGRAASQLGMSMPVAHLVEGPEGAARHLYVSSKVMPTPPGYPRRAGMAAKRPLGG